MRTVKKGNSFFSTYFILFYFAVSTETLERESRNASLLGLSAIENNNTGAAEHKRSKPASKKENFQNWLSEDSSNNIFKDEPNQCANQWLAYSSVTVYIAVVAIYLFQISV